VFVSISDGRKKNGIRTPAWREVLTDQKIWEATGNFHMSRPTFASIRQVFHPMNSTLPLAIRSRVVNNVNGLAML
jgi:hypothetical protein